MSARRVALAAVAALSTLACALAEERGDRLWSEWLWSDWLWSLPRGVDPPPVPADNPMSRARVELGRRLFFDIRLSGPATVSCGSCHLRGHAYADPRARSVGATGETTPRNSPSVANAAWRATLGWANPEMTTLETQAEAPLFGASPVEMGVNEGNRAAVLARFSAAPDYRELFARAFAGEDHPIGFENIIKAIAAFERSLVSFSSKYDLSLEGRARLDEREARGRALFFGRAGCSRCHGGPGFDDQSFRDSSAAPPFHNTGLYDLDGAGAYPDYDRGLIERTRRASDMGRFRAPSLRNVAVTAPYMHDGSVATLEQAIDHYAAGGRLIAGGPLAGDGRSNPFKSPLVAPLDLDARDRADLVAFLSALTDAALLAAPRRAPPRAGGPK